MSLKPLIAGMSQSPRIGTAGALDIGTTANTVMAGDDSRVTRFVYDVAAANQTVTSSTTPTSSEVSVPLTVGKWYLDSMAAFLLESVTPGQKACFTFSGTIAILAGTSYHEYDNTSNAFGLSPGSGANWIEAANASSRVSGATLTNLLRVVGTYNVTVAGTLTLQFAQAASNADDTTLLAGSYIRAEKLA